MASTESYSYRALREYPLIVVAGVSEVQVFSDLNKRITVYYWVCSAMSLVIVMFVAILLVGLAQRRSIRLQEILRKIAEAAVLAKSLEELFAEVHRIIGKVLPTQNFNLALLDETKQQIVDGYSVDVHGAIPRCRPLAKGLTEYALRQGKTMLLSHSDIQRLQASGEVVRSNSAPIHAWLGTPLIDAKGEAFGVMALLSREAGQSFSPDDVEVFSIIAEQVALTIERKQAEEKIRASQVRYQTLMEQSSEALLLVEIQTQQVLEVNRRFTELLGYSLPADAPLYVKQFVHASQEELDHLYNVVLSEQRFIPAEPRRLRHKNGVDVLVDRAGTVINIEGRDFFLASMRDMTTERRLQAELTRDVEFARRVQRELLPILADSPQVRIRTFYHPVNFVSGDSFLLEWQNDGAMLRGFLIDVSGHGLATAIQTAAINVLLREAASSKLPLLAQLQQVNSHAAKYFTDGAYAAIIGFELDLSQQELRYVGAGITQLLVNGRKIETPGMFVGLWDDAEFEQGVLTVSAGDSFCFLTDGFTDCLAAGKPDQPTICGDFDAMVETLEKLMKTGGLRDDATGICLKLLQ